MSRREAATVAQNIRSAADATANTIQSVAEATDVPISKIVAHPSAGELTFSEIVAVGGFLSLRPSSFLKGVNP